MPGAPPPQLPAYMQHPQDCPHCYQLPAPQPAPLHPPDRQEQRQGPSPKPRVHEATLFSPASRAPANLTLGQPTSPSLLLPQPPD